MGGGLALLTAALVVALAQAAGAAGDAPASGEPAGAEIAQTAPTPLPTGLGALVAPDGVVTLTWDDGPNEGYTIFRDGTVVGSATFDATSFVDDDPPPPQGQHTYEVQADGLTAPPASVTVTVDPEPVPPPSPDGLAASVTGDTVSLTWDAVGVAGSYGVYRDGNRIGTTTDPSFQDPDLADGPYTYHVTSLQGDLESGPSSSVDALVVTPPPAPRDLAATAEGDTVSLTWAPPAEAGDVGGYRVYRDGSPIGRTSQPGFADTGLDQGTHAYTVTAVHRLDDAVESEPAGPAQADVLIRPAPPELEASVDGDTVTLTWESPPGIGGHRIYRDGVQLAERPAAARTYVDRDLPPGTHIYRVSVVHRLDPSIEVASAPARVVVEPPPPPPAPAITARLDGDDVVLDWTWAPAPGGPPAAGFTLFRDGTAVAIPSGGTRTSRDADPAPGTYTYWLFAHDTAGRTSPRSNQTTILVPAPQTGDGDGPTTGTGPDPVTDPGPIIDPTPRTDPDPTPARPGDEPSGGGDGDETDDGADDEDQPADGAEGEQPDGTDDGDDDGDRDGDEAAQLEIGGPAVDSGAEVDVAGAFCPAGAAVSVAIDGTEVAATSADDDGAFRATVNAPPDAGRHDVTVTCDGTTRTSPLDVVVSTNVGGAATSTVGTVLAFFLFIGVVLWPRATR